MNVPLYGDEYRKLFGNMATLHPTAQDEPNMTIKVSAGGFWTYIGAAAYIEYVGGSSPTITAPAANAKWVVVCLTRTGILANVDGVSAVNPVLPTISTSLYPIALVYVQAGDVKITNEYVFDARPIFSLPIRAHSHLEGITSADCHPTSAVTGLDAALAAAALSANVTAALALKADVGGTPSETFKMNQDYTGVPGADVTFEVERGAEVNVAIRWNETDNLWEYTNDGAVWHYFTSNDGTEDIMIKTYTQDAEPTLDTDNKAAIWVDSDDANRVYLVFRRGVGDQVKVELT
jgi:hypothetical protein